MKASAMLATVALLAIEVTPAGAADPARAEAFRAMVADTTQAMSLITCLGLRVSDGSDANPREWPLSVVEQLNSYGKAMRKRADEVASLNHPALDEDGRLALLYLGAAPLGLLGATMTPDCAADR